VTNSKSGNKAARVAERKRVRNYSAKHSVKTYVAKAEKAISTGEASAHDATMKAVSSVDKAISKGIMHKNKGAHVKSRLVKELNLAMSQKGEG